jgi:hypothetical protein
MEIVIGREWKAYAISTGVKKLWKADLDSSFLSLRILARAGALTSPLPTVRVLFGIAGPRTAGKLLAIGILLNFWEQNHDLFF